MDYAPRCSHSHHWAITSTPRAEPVSAVDGDFASKSQEVLRHANRLIAEAPRSVGGDEARCCVSKPTPNLSTIIDVSIGKGVAKTRFLEGDYDPVDDCK